MVIGRAADIRVAGTRGGRRGIGLERHAIKAVLEHRLDMSIRPGAGGDRPTAGGLDPFGAVLLREAQQAETGPIALLRMRPARENLRDQGGGLRSQRGPPADQAGRTPLQMRAVRVGHVRGDRRIAHVRAAAMHPDPRASLKHFDRRGGEERRYGHRSEEMKTDNVVTAVEWDYEDVPAIIPKRLWDSLLNFHELVIVLATEACGTAQLMIDRPQNEQVGDAPQLSELKKILSETLEDLGREKDQLYRFRSLLKWVPPADLETKH